MLDTVFERPLGDAGNPDSYPFPARIERVQGAGSLDIVKDGRPSPELVDRFIQAAQKLENDGAFALTSTCGFLITIQKDIATSVSIPVMVSALAMYPVIKAKHSGGLIGILTASKPSLGEKALLSAEIDPDDVVIEGMEECPAFVDAILRPKDQQLLEIEQSAIEEDIVQKAKTMLGMHPEIAAFLLECGNLPPYQKAISVATNRPVYSILDGVEAMVSKID